jgi:uncharacterized protein YbcI
MPAKAASAASRLHSRWCRWPPGTGRSTVAGSSRVGSHRLRTSLECDAEVESPVALDPITTEPNGDNSTSVLVQVSRAIVGVYKEQFGRGPDRVRTYHAGPDALVCFLEGTLTPVERTLTTINEHQRLREMRMLFQHTAEETFRTAVEDITNRSVIAFSSGIDTTADVATEVFVFKPLTGA